jgi:transposase InsO family protein
MEGINGIQLKILQQASMEFSEFAQSSPLREWREAYESAFEQLWCDDFHMRFPLSAWKYLCTDVVCCDRESVGCCRSNTPSGRW